MSTERNLKNIFTEPFPADLNFDLNLRRLSNSAVSGTQIRENSNGVNSATMHPAAIPTITRDAHYAAAVAAAAPEP